MPADGAGLLLITPARSLSRGRKAGDKGEETTGIDRMPTREAALRCAAGEAPPARTDAPYRGKATAAVMLSS